jgi:hypothetical protein
VQIVEFTADSLRFSDTLPAQAPSDGFVWVFLDRYEVETQESFLQQAAQQLGGTTLLDLHSQDLRNPAHCSHYDYTSIYDLIIFRRLATQSENHAEDENEAAVEIYHGQGGEPSIKPRGGLPRRSRAAHGQHHGRQLHRRTQGAHPST